MILTDLDLTNIDGVLSSCTIQELQAIKVELTLVLNKVQVLLAKENSKIQETDEELFYNCLVSKCKEKLGGYFISFNIYRNRGNYYKLQEALHSVNTFLSTWYLKGNIGTKEEKVQIYKLYADLLFSYAKEINIPIIVNSLVNCYERFPSLLNKAYPGYVESGLLGLILNTVK